MHGASAALRDAAAKFRAGEPEMIPQDPQQRRAGCDSTGCFTLLTVIVMAMRFLLMRRNGLTCWRRVATVVALLAACTTQDAWVGLAKRSRRPCRKS